MIGASRSSQIGRPTRLASSIVLTVALSLVAFALPGSVSSEPRAAHARIFRLPPGAALNGQPVSALFPGLSRSGEELEFRKGALGTLSVIERSDGAPGKRGYLLLGTDEAIYFLLDDEGILYLVDLESGEPELEPALGLPKRSYERPQRLSRLAFDGFTIESGKIRLSAKPGGAALLKIDALGSAGETLASRIVAVGEPPRGARGRKLGLSPAELPEALGGNPIFEALAAPHFTARWQDGNGEASELSGLSRADARALLARAIRQRSLARRGLFSAEPLLGRHEGGPEYYVSADGSRAYKASGGEIRVVFPRSGARRIRLSRLTTPGEIYRAAKAAGLSLRAEGAGVVLEDTSAEAPFRLSLTPSEGQP